MWIADRIITYSSARMLQAFLHGEAPLEQCAFTSNMALSAMKVTTSSGTGAARIFYRHVSVRARRTRATRTHALDPAHAHVREHLT